MLQAVVMFGETAGAAQLAEVRRAATISTFLDSHVSIVGNVTASLYSPTITKAAAEHLIFCFCSLQIKIQPRAVPAPSTKKAEISALILRCDRK